MNIPEIDCQEKTVDEDDIYGGDKREEGEQIMMLNEDGTWIPEYLWNE